ncbi:MAG TPA: DHA2 family efflux MFS transporter permease subunit [Ilumatobacteraceae bacterium]
MRCTCRHCWSISGSSSWSTTRRTTAFAPADAVAGAESVRRRPVRRQPSLGSARECAIVVRTGPPRDQQLVGDDDGLALKSAPGRIALTATVAASSMAMLDATVVNVALPHIGADFGVSVSALQWVLTGYLLALASLILLGGALGDRFGRRKVFLAGTVWFAAASLLCGVAPNVDMLIAARALQGVGAALLTPGSLAILQASFREDDRARAVGAWSGLGGVAGAIGPFVGGWLVDGPGWRWAFLINLPVAAIVVACAVSAIPETRDPHAARGLDIGGAALAVGCLGTATWSLTEAGPRGWGSAGVLISAVAALIFALAFVRRMLHARDPLVPPALFANRSFTVTNLVTVLLYSALGVSFFLVAYELQVGAGWSAMRAGTALLPATILMLLLSSKSGALGRKIGPRWQLTVGPLLLAAGLLLLMRIGPGASWAGDALPGALVFGVGLVTFVAPLTATVMGSVDPDHVSVASGVNNAIARTANLAALAVIPVVSGLTSASGVGEVTHAFRVSLVIAAVVAAVAAPVAFIGLKSDARWRRSARDFYCSVDGPPLQPDPQRCPTAA